MLLGTVDQIIVDNTIMDEIREKRRNLAVEFYDYRKAYDRVRHDWMLRVYRWMGVPGKVVNVLSQLMEGWKTRLEVTDKGNKIDVKKVMQRVKKEIAKRLEQLIEVNLNDENLVKAIHSRVVPVAGYVMNVCNLGKGDIEELDKIVKTTLRKQGFHGRQVTRDCMEEEKMVDGE